MKFYTLQPKQKPKVGVSNGILRSFKTATLENNFWARRAASERKTEEEKDAQ